MKIKTIRAGDLDWFIDDGILIVPRAAFEITKDCPDRYAIAIKECINQGWLKAIAYQPVHEEFIERLTK